MFELLNTAVTAGGEVLLKYFRTQTLDITNKTDHQNIVTIADKESQNAIQQTIIRLMKAKGVTDVGFIGEENLYHKGKHMFVIDPLDGTSNFASGIDYFCIPVAYFIDGQIQSSIISRPVTGDIYFAQKGLGASHIRNNEKTKLQIRHTPLKEKMLSAYSEDMLTLQPAVRTRIEQSFTSYRGVRALGAAALDILGVAENTYGCSLLTYGPWIWDIAAAQLILEESGGATYTWEGKPLMLDIEKKQQYGVVSCHPAQKEEIFSYLLD